MTVNIDIDLNARSAHVKLGALKAQIEALEDDIDLDLDLDGDLGDTLDDLTDTMDELSESFNSDLNETIDRLEALELDDIGVVERGNGDSGGDTGSDSGDGGRDGTATRRMRNLFDAFDRGPKEIFARMGIGSSGDGSSGSGFDREKLKDFRLFGGDGPIMPKDLEVEYNMDEERRDSLQNMIDSIFTQEDFEFEISRTHSNREGKLYGDTNYGLMSWDQYDKARGIERQKTHSGLPGSDDDRNNRSLLSGLSGFNKKLNRGFRKLIPSMSTWINMVGAAVPALAAMAVQAAGVASAMGAMALAGGAIIGLGLVGHGDSMAESFRNAQQRVADLKKEVFEEFEPTADLFSGIQAEFFDFIPGEMSRIATSMEGLTVFKDDLFELFRGGTQFISEFFGIITDNADLIGYLTERFSSLLGSSVLDLFKGLLSTTSENQEMLVQLGKTLKVVAAALYEVFLMVSKAIIWLAPLFVLIAHGAKLLNNDFAAAMLGSIALLYILGSILPGIYLGFQALGFALQRTTIPAISSLMSYVAGVITQFLVWIGINGALAASIAAVSTALLTLAAISGIGLAISGAGLLGMQGMKSQIPSDGDYSPGGSGSGSGTTIINEGDNVNVDLSNADTSTVEKFSDMGSGGGDRGPTGGSYTSD